MASADRIFISMRRKNGQSKREREKRLAENDGVDAEEEGERCAKSFKTKTILRPKQIYSGYLQILFIASTTA